MKILLIIPSEAKLGLETLVRADQHPTMDYDALTAALRAGGDRVDVIDYCAAERDTDPLVSLVRKVAGKNAALAMMAFQRRQNYDTIFTNAENVALPLAMLLKTVSQRPRHVTIAHRLSAKRKRVFYTLLGVHRQMDAIFVYASSQREFASKVLGIPKNLLRLIPFHADHKFYRPMAERPVRDNQICAAGLEWRDYPTLIDAVEDQPELSVRLAAASPWSKHSNETEARPLPANVDARRYDYRALRDLYAESSFVVVPLYENDFQAGITTILEAMAMGKPVAVSGTKGQTDAVIDGINGLYVMPESVAEWRKVIARLRSDSVLRARLGRRARRWIEENATLDHWVGNIVAALHDLPVRVEEPARDIAAERVIPAVLDFDRSVPLPVQPDAVDPASLSLIANASLSSGELTGQPSRTLQ